ncbi:CAP domain-containing protein [Syncephalis pseudoplumigaleata]|nr:CAP domain-containing protein [Syncephalis pseudoplumigaleata]|eukprot:RKP24312.1 CAP domain-containing protein [Syncephalis pseudoplumigaleata]
MPVTNHAGLMCPKFNGRLELLAGPPKVGDSFYQVSPKPHPIDSAALKLEASSAHLAQCFNFANQGWVLNMVNNYRARVGSPPVQYNWQLERMANDHSVYQYNANTMTHYDPAGDLGTRMTRMGINWQAIGENVAFNYPDEGSVMDGWLRSPGHERNIRNPSFTQMGVARVGNYWTQVFMRTF